MFESPRLRFRRHHKDIANTANGAYPIAAVQSAAQLLTQIADVHVDAAILRHGVAAQNLLDNFLALQHFDRTLHKKCEQIEFHGGKVHVAMAPAHGSGAFIEFNIAQNDPLRTTGNDFADGGGAAAQHGLNTRGKFAGIERFSQVIVGADFETQDAIDILIAGSEHDDGHGGLGADLTQGFKTANTREHHVEDQQRVVPAQGAVHTFQSVEDGIDVKTFRLQVFRKQFAQLEVIVDYENARSGMFGEPFDASGLGHGKRVHGITLSS